MQPARILVLGGGFAGLWSAVGAARKLAELGVGPKRAVVTLVNRDPYHSIRVRNYERDISDARVPLDEVLGPIGVGCIEAEVLRIDTEHHTVTLRDSRGAQMVPYDRLVFALGSELRRPHIAGLREHGFDVDTFAGATKLAEHLERLSALPACDGRSTVVVVGAGLTGIEVATEMCARLEHRRDAKVILVDHNAQIGSDMGPEALPHIENALDHLGIERRTSTDVCAVETDRVGLSSGESIETCTVVWCAGMRSNQLTAQIPGQRDHLGRLMVDRTLRVLGVPDVFAAGDSACEEVSQHHASVMSCQHARPMGRFAGHNAVCDLFGLPPLPLTVDWYVTVLDLGAEGALYTEGWDRHVVAEGSDAKLTKKSINRARIYPPRSGDRAEIFEAGRPFVQERPPVRSTARASLSVAH